MKLKIIFGLLVLILLIGGCSNNLNTCATSIVNTNNPLKSELEAGKNPDCRCDVLGYTKSSVGTFLVNGEPILAKDYVGVDVVYYCKPPDFGPQ